jgi:hypothetical protein
MMYMPVMVNMPTPVQQLPYAQDESPPQASAGSREELEARAANLEREAAELKRRAKEVMLEAAAMTKTSPTSQSEPVVWVMQQAVQSQPSPCQASDMSSQTVQYYPVCQAMSCQVAACPPSTFQAMPVLCQAPNQQSVAQSGPVVACFVVSQDMGFNGVACQYAMGNWESADGSPKNQVTCKHQVIDGSSRQDARTTLMLRNLPNDYTRDMTIEVLNKKGLAGQYDFFYTPIDFNTNAGLGYAFVNAVSHDAALAMWKTLQDFNEWEIPSHKILDISWSELSQGLEAHIERYRNSPVMHPDVPQEFKPVIFCQGVLQEFPAATKQIHAPRLKALGQRKSIDPQSTETNAQVVEKRALTPWDRIKKTIAMINSGDIGRICAHARDTLASTVVCCVPRLGEFRSISEVCSFHQRLHEALPDLKFSLENIEVKMGTTVVWRVTCNGTQIKPFLPWLSVGVRKTFTLQVTVQQNQSGKPKWLEWSFGIEDEVQAEFMQDGQEHIDCKVDEKKLQHLRGECTPCAYFAFRPDGCRRGDECPFCHYCTKTQARAKKKAKALKMQQAKSNEDASTSASEEDESN